MAGEKKFKGVGVGAGYFSHYQYDSWNRIPTVTISAIYNRTRSKAEEMLPTYNIARCYDDYRVMLDAEEPDFVDIITPPETHYEICKEAADRGIHIICQKPLAPTYEESKRIVDMVSAAGVRFMVHENVRWQPWYREAKTLLDDETLGEPFSLYFRFRTGDGRGDDAYLARQPFFRDYPRLLVYETGVHWIDTFRYLLGEVETVYARLRQLNPVIKGEDSGQIIFGFANGATAIYDANRYNEIEVDNPRLTFGEMRLDASKGHLQLEADGNLWIKPLDQPTMQHHYAHEDRGFAGDCVHALQCHFVEQMSSGEPFEASGEDYLRTIRVVEACYESAKSGQVVKL